jgi:cold shock CspA family protein
MHSRRVHCALNTLAMKGENGMKKKALVGLIAFLGAIAAASAASSKGVHATTMSGTVSALDQKAKTFSLTDEKGKQTPITWTAATKVRGGALKDGERVNVSVFQKDGKNIATSIRIASAKMAKAS